MNLGIVVLVITGFIALFAISFIIIAAIISENNVRRSSNIEGNIAFGENPISSHLRISLKSTNTEPLSSEYPPFSSTNNIVEKSLRCKNLKEIVSPNHWIGSALYDNISGGENFFSLYPYIVNIRDDCFVFSWPSNGNVRKKTVTSGICTNTYPLGCESLNYIVEHGPTLKLGNNGKKLSSCDILDIDPLISTVAWRYGTDETIIIPLAQGSPYITAELINSEATIECNCVFSLESNHGNMIYTIKIGDNEGFLIFLSKEVTVTKKNESSVFIPRMTGVIRLAYFSSIDMINILIKHSDIYPVESTVDCKTSLSNETATSWDVDTFFTWTIKSMSNQQPAGKSPLMLALPHHNISNIKYESNPIDYPIIGPFKFVTTNDNTWSLADAVANYQFDYPTPPMSGDMLQVWKDEIETISMLKPKNTTEWMKWLGTLASMILMGNMLKQDVKKYRDILETQLSNINSATYNTFMYDETWGGIIDNENKLYDSHIGRYGYLIFAYAVASKFNPDFLSKNKESAMSFVRDLANSCQSDDSFPMWRNKNWYLGYSSSSGLLGKDTTNIGETILGYYGVYLMSQVLKSESLSKWSLALLATEISSLQHYFQFSSYNTINVDPMFNKGIITNRGDNYYSYDSNKSTSELEGTAHALTTMIKPLNLMSFDYINTDWASGLEKYLSGEPDDKIRYEQLGYTLAMLTVNNNNKEIKRKAIDTIVSNHNIVLPYGSTWSSILYWVLHQ